MELRGLQGLGRLAFALGTSSLLAACAHQPVALVASVPVIPAVTIQNLVGSTPSILSAEFGQPALLRVDGTAQVWLYHSDVCGLNLILYPDPKGVPRVAEAVPDNGDAARCTASMQHGLTDAGLEPTPAS